MIIQRCHVIFPRQLSGNPPSLSHRNAEPKNSRACTCPNVPSTSSSSSSSSSSSWPPSLNSSPSSSHRRHCNNSTLPPSNVCRRQSSVLRPGGGRRQKTDESFQTTAVKKQGSTFAKPTAGLPSRSGLGLGSQSVFQGSKLAGYGDIQRPSSSSLLRSSSSSSPYVKVRMESKNEMDDGEGDDEGEEEGEELSVDAMELEARLAAEHHRQEILQGLLAGDEEQRKGGRGRKKGQQHREVHSQIPESLLPRIAIVGRPNVGKSALFNRIVGGDQAIVHNEPGVTRDRLYRRAFWCEHEFLIIDTGGVVNAQSMEEGAVSEGVTIGKRGGADSLFQAAKDGARSGLPSMIERHVALAVEEAAAVIMVVDGQAGLVGSDIEIATWLRRKHPNKHITLAVNKCESPTKGVLQCAEFWSLGHTPFAVSAISGTGTGDFLDDVCSGLQDMPKAEEFDVEDDENRPLGIAMVGRPNVGKSSIMNAILGEERTIVSPLSGTTRDAIDSDFTAPNGKAFRLIDTAGIRRRASVAAANSRAESLSINRAFRAVRRADVVALVIDAKDGVTEQDGRLADRIQQEGKACIIILNKWDTVPDKETNTMDKYTDAVRMRLAQIDWAPIVYTSATSGQRIPRILEAAMQVGEERCRRLSTATLNAVMLEAYTFRQPPTSAGKKGRIYYCTQAAIRPPTFVFFVNDAHLFPEAYRKYMEKQLRSNVGYKGTPVRLLWRSKRRDPDRAINISKARALTRP